MKIVESKKIPVELSGDDLALFEVLEAKIRTPGMKKSEKSKKIIQMAIFALECKFNEFSEQSGHKFPGFEAFQCFLGIGPQPCTLDEQGVILTDSVFGSQKDRD